jgi:molybdopterin converting factor small subunit
VNVYVDGVDVREHDGMDTRLEGPEEIRLVAAIAGG